MPGDWVLTDWGFTIHEGARLYCDEVKIPLFTHGKRQLDKVEIEKSKAVEEFIVTVGGPNSDEEYEDNYTHSGDCSYDEPEDLDLVYDNDNLRLLYEEE